MYSNGERDNDLKDVDLCYKGLGIPFDSSPDEVERAYRSLSERFKKDMLSPDSATRSKAKEDADIVNNLYEKIRNSVNYQRKMRERSYAPEGQDRAERRKPEAGGPRIILRICPSCNNSINKALKVCPFCKKRIYSSGFEKFWVEKITSKNLLLTFTILSCIALVAVIAINFRGIIGFVNQLIK